ncbi:MAG: hypothetical protein HOD11_12150 [Candidatus Marinimicrobia bacterium]|nr:hypothetical protein [Candidatus Neomarinimicrobiota bacterium]MBT4361709.1 hypothetical protein [Candidatus Neomarinimicrobiota bacterium]MBT4993292.1 hypothetical protein [Candidatus Neomarinimicrobiota bacterium]MBT5314844.1 hypothetical protein [Candidatus Neomarinimicrobiota bacterium]MBT6012935.1 hypothetical protein [Candidatus Neomarinimicrobiota bacterium]
MTDTINVNTPFFSVGKQNMLLIDMGDFDPSTGDKPGVGLLWTNGMKSTSGKKAFYREKGIYISIVPGKPGNSPLLLISINPGILINGHNFFPVTFQELVKCLAHVSRVLTKVGITTNIDLCKLARIDIFKNIELDYDFNYYLPPVRLMSPKSMSQKGVTNYEDSFQIQNKSLEHNFYNKISQTISKYHFDPTTIGVTSPNVGRFETRFMNHRIIKNRFGIETVGELMRNNSFSHVTDVYENELKKNFFRFQNIANQVVPIDTDKDMLLRIREKYPKIAPELFFTYKQLMGDKLFNIDDWVSLMDSVGVKDSTIKDRKKQMMEVIKIGLELKQEPLQVSELLRELFTKLVN